MTVHPARVVSTVRCVACGNVFTTRSNLPAITVEVCSNCHPAYTGRERELRSGGRIERFERRRARSLAANSHLELSLQRGGTN